MGNKRKSKSGEDSKISTGKQKCVRRTCVIHFPQVAENDNFVPFSSINSEPSTKLSYLLDISKRRLSQPADSPYRMTIQCNLLPESLNDLDVETVGYHRTCYQTFTKNLDRLQEQTAEASCSSQKCFSPRKASSTHVLFSPNECLFCEKKCN